MIKIIICILIGISIGIPLGVTLTGIILHKLNVQVTWYAPGGYSDGNCCWLDDEWKVEEVDDD